MEFIENMKVALENFLDNLADFFRDNPWINPFTLFLILIAIIALIMIVDSIIHSFKNRNQWKKLGYSSKREYEEAQESEALAALGIDEELTDTQAKYLNILEDTWAKDSTQDLTGQATTNFIKQTQTNLEALRENHLDRDFDFQPKRQKTYYPSQTDYKSDGRVVRHQVELAGKSSYTWKDLRTGRALVSKEYESSIIHFNTASGVYDSEGRSVCKNCGAGVEVQNFDSYECPFCKSIIYKSDYEDLLTSYSIIGLSKSEEQARQRAEVTDASGLNRILLFMIPILIVVFVALGIIVLLALRQSGNETASNVVGVLTVIGAVVFSIYAIIERSPELSKRVGKSARSTIRNIARQETKAERIAREEAENLSELVSEDPEFSIDLAISEAIFMFKSLWLDENRSKQTWGVFTSPTHREELVEKHQADGNILDLLVNESVFNDYYKDADGQKIRIYISYDVLRPKSKSELKLKTREYMLTLARNEDGTSVVLDGHSECASCGAPVDILTMDSCAYCNTGLHRDSMLWRITELEEVDSDFKDRLEEKRKIRPKSSFRNILREI